MGYKTKSMINQLSGLSANYLLKKELNKFTDKISEPTKQGESIAKSTKKFRPFEILKSKDSARDKDEKKQVRRAGRKAARNTDVDFVKATPMGSDYFSLMAATAENLASRGAGKRKAKRAAKSLKREMFSEGRDAKPTESKGFKEIQSKKTTPKSENIVPKNATETKIEIPLNRFKQKKKGNAAPPSSVSDVNKAIEKEMQGAFGEDVGVMEGVMNLKPGGFKESTQPPTNEENFKKLTRSEGRKPINRNDLATPKSKTNNFKGLTSDNIAEITRAYNKLGQPEKAREAVKALKEQQIDEDQKLTGTNIPSYLSIPKSETDKFDASIKKSNQEKAEKMQLKEQEEIRKAKALVSGLQMTGDGFNKGMSRKNKYKK